MSWDVIWSTEVTNKFIGKVQKVFSRNSEVIFSVTNDTSFGQSVNN